ncbi:MAG: SPOR domain-containing protein [Brumimicrobium sp.]|nr:SPOR domain-containing protein [Brumimicrobium sp.]
MKISFILLIVISLIHFSGLSQQFTDEQIKQMINTGTEGELVEINTVLNIEGSYYQAGMVADKLLQFKPESANYNYRKAYALIKSGKGFNEAKPLLQKAVTNISKNYDMVSTSEKGAPVDALFYMGRSYHLANEIDKAKEYYTNFLDRCDKKSELKPQAELKLKQCEVATIQLKEALDFTVENVGSRVNSSEADFSPVISLDGYAIYFTSRRLRPDSSNLGIYEPGTKLYLEDVYVSRKNENGEWMEPQMMNFCLPDKNEATVAVSTDERRIYCYKDEQGNGDIYYSDFEGSKFRELQHDKTEGVNTDAWETHITVTPDGTQKYFVSDREGGYGGRDIYRIIKMPNGQWSKPQNLGPGINTPYDEDAPFLAVDNKTMYFASNGPNSMGGFDIFKTVRDENDIWSPPVNLGYPLNTTSDDIYYTTTVDGFTGYLTSYRENGYGEKDIYEIKNDFLGIDNISVLQGEVETVNNDPLPEDIAFTLKCLDCENWFDIEFFPRISDGTFVASLQQCHEYVLIMHRGREKEEIYRDKITTTCDFSYEEIYRHIILDVPNMKVIEPQDHISSFKPLSMKHLFGYNKNKLDPQKGALSLFLDSLEQQIVQGRREIVLTINSSASKVTTRTFKNNQELAQKRASELKSLLLDYFSERKFGDSISVEIKEVVVQGPEYERDYRNIEKYAPYQYVSLHLDGINSVSDDMLTFKSKDEILEDQLQGKPLNNGTTSTDTNGDTFTSGQMIESDYKFHVIVGVFQKLDNAEGMVRSISKKGFKGEIIGKRNGLHVVSAGSSNSFNATKEILDRARQEVVQSAWILNSKK